MVAVCAAIRPATAARVCAFVDEPRRADLVTVKNRCKSLTRKYANR